MARRPQTVPASVSFNYAPDVPTGANYRNVYNLVWCGAYDLVKTKTGKQEKVFHHFNPEKTRGKCGCPPGPSVLALESNAVEVAGLGGRAGMKTDIGLIIAMRPSRDPEHPSYINYENYRCLILRRNSTDLEDWWSRGKRLYCKMGAEALGDPKSGGGAKFRWPTGAEFHLDHIQNSSAYEKYMGQEYHTVIWEEIGHCPQQKLYRDVIRSMRCSDPRMNQKIYCTANPDGAGLNWVREYFWDLKMCRTCELPEPVCKFIIKKNKTALIGGRKYPPCQNPDYQAIRRGEIWYDPNFPRLTRTCVYSNVYDNPYIQQNDPAYVSRLEAETGTERKRWLYGDFNVFEGQAFDMFRPEGPEEGDPPNARHVIEVGSRPMMPWWPRVVGMDIGFRHSGAIGKACITPEKQLLVYGEDAAPGITSKEWGTRLARFVQPELQESPEQVIEVYLSHDAFAKVGYEKTRAAMIQEGVEEVLGSKAAFLLEQEQEESTQNFMERYRAWGPAARLAIRRVPNYWKRVDAWDYIRELMRFRQFQPDIANFSNAYADQLVSEGKFEEHRRYVASFEPREPESLPRLLITGCPKLVKALRTAQFAAATSNEQRAEDVLKTETESDDVLDMFRHMALGFQWKVNFEPRETWVQKKIEDSIRRYPQLSPAQLFQVKMSAHEQYEQQKRPAAGFTIRFGGPDHRGLRLQ